MNEKTNRAFFLSAGVLLLLVAFLTTSPSSTAQTDNQTEVNGTAYGEVEGNVIIEITDDIINLSTVAVGATKDSEDVDDFFTVENNGSVTIDVKAYGDSSPFTGPSAGSLPTSEFQIHANSSQSGTATEAYANVPANAGSATLLVDGLLADDSQDEAEIGIQVTVPSDEAVGQKSAIVTLLAEQDV